MIARLRQEEGFTVMEVLIATLVGFVVLAAAMGLLESTVRLNTGVMGKTDAMQRGRLAMDKITQQLRSQVCLDLDNAAIPQGATNTSVTFYADFSSADGKKPPQKRTLTFDSTKRSITASIFKTAVLKPLPTSYPATPYAIDPVLENVGLAKNSAGVDLPFLTYYAYQTVNGHPEPTQLLTTPLSKAAAARVARIDINYSVRPTGANNDKQAVSVSDQIVARHADPNLSVPDPACV